MSRVRPEILTLMFGLGPVAPAIRAMAVQPFTHDELVREYRRTLLLSWSLTAVVTTADLEELAGLYERLVELCEALGRETANRLGGQWAASWWRKIGLCPWCRGTHGTKVNEKNRTLYRPPSDICVATLKNHIPYPVRSPMISPPLRLDAPISMPSRPSDAKRRG
jgi:hypothetical protein